MFVVTALLNGIMHCFLFFLTNSVISCRVHTSCPSLEVLAMLITQATAWSDRDLADIELQEQPLDNL